jgi:glycosyltransferase involved in cell wall biosynthesis
VGRTVFFIGPLPPPVNGFSVISQCMLSVISARFRVKAFNQAPSSSTGVIGRLADFLRFGVQIVRFGVLLALKRGSVVYLALSGGQRQAGDFLFLSIACFLRKQVFIHHHSFGYLNKPNSLTRLLLEHEPMSCHIVLCDYMREQLTRAYAIEEKRVLTVSNAAFVESVVLPSGLSPRGPGIRIGFLSNVTPEKGIAEFLDVVKACNLEGLDCRAIVAGPLDDEYRKVFFLAISGMQMVNYWGAIYGQRKAEFFRCIDVLVFPSRYANEAEPVTILEAAAAGVMVVASDRGCINEMLENIGGNVISRRENFCESAVDLIRRITSTDNLAEMRMERASRFTAFRQTALSKVDLLLDLMNGCSERR